MYHYKNLLLCGLMLLVGQIAFGQRQTKFKFQNKPTPQKFSVNTSANNSNFKPDKLIDKLVRELDLNENDTKIVNNLVEQRAEKIERIKLNHDHINQKIIDLNSVNAEFENKLRSVLSPGQFVRYEQFTKN